MRAPFGVALQGIRDNPRRMDALGFHVTAHRVAAHAAAGLLAAVGGVLMVWYNARISPGTMNTGAMINILIIAVLGGMKHPIGAFIGAIVFVLLQNFAIDLVDRERFNLVIGGVFLAIVLFSPTACSGCGRNFASRSARSSPTSNTKGDSSESDEENLARSVLGLAAAVAVMGDSLGAGDAARSACWPRSRDRSQRRDRTACAVPTWR